MGVLYETEATMTNKHCNGLATLATLASTLTVKTHYAMITFVIGIMRGRANGFFPKELPPTFWAQLCV